MTVTTVTACKDSGRDSGQETPNTRHDGHRSAHETLKQTEHTVIKSNYEFEKTSSKRLTVMSKMHILNQLCCMQWQIKIKCTRSVHFQKLKESAGNCNNFFF